MRFRWERICDLRDGLLKQASELRLYAIEMPSAKQERLLFEAAAQLEEAARTINSATRIAVLGE